MSDDSVSKDWSSILNAVKTPLGFFTLVALILDGILISLATLTDKLSMLAPFGLLAFLVALVFAIVWKKPEHLYHPKDWRIVNVRLIFPSPIEPIQIDLDIQKCALEIRDTRGRASHRNPNLAFNHGGWTLRLDEDVGVSDSVRLNLTERNGRAWRVNPFSPYENEQNVLAKI